MPHSTALSIFSINIPPYPQSSPFPHLYPRSIDLDLQLELFYRMYLRLIEYTAHTLNSPFSTHSHTHTHLLTHPPNSHISPPLPHKRTHHTHRSSSASSCTRRRRLSWWSTTSSWRLTLQTGEELRGVVYVVCVVCCVLFGCFPTCSSLGVYIYISASCCI